MAASASIEMLRVWVHATNRGTRQFLSAWRTGPDADQTPSRTPSDGDNVDDDSAPPTPVVIAAICAPDTEDQPLEHHYTSYDSDDGCGDGCTDEDTHLELLKQLDASHPPPSSGSASRATYTMYSSQRSGSAA